MTMVMKGFDSLAGFVVKPKTVTLTWQEWHAVTDNPCQRDTVRHAARANHLKNFSVTHENVAMAELPDGTRYKLDGHTRAYMWFNSLATPPETVTAVMYYLDSIDAVKDVYKTFDSVKATETQLDRVFGSLNEHAMTFETPMLRHGRFIHGLRVVQAALTNRQDAEALTEYEIIPLWRDELAILDTMGPHTKFFMTGALAAALLTIRIDGVNALRFWTRYNDNAGNKDGKERDAVQALHERIEKLKSEKRMVGYGNVQYIFGVSLAAYVGDASNKTFTNALKPLEEVAIGRLANKASKVKHPVAR